MARFKRALWRVEQRCIDNNPVPICGALCHATKSCIVQQCCSPTNCLLIFAGLCIKLVLSSLASMLVFVTAVGGLLTGLCCSCLYHFTPEASTSRALNYFMRKLYGSKYFVEGDICGYIIAAGEHFLKGYSWLARVCWEKKLARFPTMPKTHMLWHVVFKLKSQWEHCGFFENPISMSCASDEDFIGRVCELTRKVSPRQRIRRMLERYLSQVLLLWGRADKANGRD